jgi:acetyltransferase
MVAAGLTLPPLSEKTKTVLTETLFPEASVNNPVDVLATGPAQHYRACLDAMMEDDNFDCVFVNFVTPFFVDNESIAKEIVTVSNQQKKPIVCNLMTDRRQWTEVVKILQDGGVPCYALPGEAARAMSALVHFNNIRSRRIGEVKTFTDVDKTKGTEILNTAKTEGKSNLSADHVYGILSAYNIPVADWRLATNAEDADRAAAEIGYPVVIKADAESIVHKSDMGGVAVDLQDGNAVRGAIKKMQQNFSAKDLRFFVQKYLPGGLELIMGAKVEKGLGHAVMFGLGGIYVEIMKDVVFNLTPVASGEAKEMLSSIKGSVMLDGVRGQEGVNKTELIEIIQRLSQLLSDLPAIQEMDLNPIIAYEDRVFVVDARISL